MFDNICEHTLQTPKPHPTIMDGKNKKYKKN